ncbi:MULTISPECIES: type II toxin-antitoxin system RelB family antitoxin [Leptotrichia]|uniref:CopG domain protein DNA-binding domain protein n=2 Tax=Leptotrichia TaxID=32067 RepID=C7NCV0_LEPBD|nr:DUF6290 family protein [Leptotrichia buccalis]ACV38020.1 hypothetical protein Lebu_0089 [Leptotrichia buccalis C-1013-b]
MPTLSLRMEKEDLEFLKEYASINNLNMSSFVRNLILDKIYDEITEEDEKRILKRWKNSKSEKTASAEEVFKRLGL